MCFDHDSRPPIAPIEGGALDAREIELEAADGNRFAAYLAHAAEPTGAGIVILPDVRGLHAYYRDLALRFAEHGVDAIAIDYFGRTAGIGDRGPDFDWAPHVPQTTYEGLRDDVTAAVAHLRATTGASRVFTIGLLHGRPAGVPDRRVRAWAGGRHRLLRVAGRARRATGRRRRPRWRRTFEAPVLAIFGGADEGIGADAVATFEHALARRGVEHRVVTYPGAPHSFFDRKAEEFAETSAPAWDEVLAFIRRRARTHGMSFLAAPVRRRTSPARGRHRRTATPGDARPTRPRASASCCARRPTASTTTSSSASCATRTAPGRRRRRAATAGPTTKRRRPGAADEQVARRAPTAATGTGPEPAAGARTRSRPRLQCRRRRPARPSPASRRAGRWSSDRKPIAGG